MARSFAALAPLVPFAPLAPLVCLAALLAPLGPARARSEDELRVVLHAAGHVDEGVKSASGVELRDGGASLRVADPAGGAWRFESTSLAGGRCSGGSALEVLGGEPLLVRVRVDVELTGTDACMRDGDGLACPCELRREDHLYTIDRHRGDLVGSRIVVTQERWPDDTRAGRSRIVIGDDVVRGDFTALVRKAEDARTTAARVANEARVAELVRRGRERTRAGEHALAIADFDEAVRLDPWTARAWSGRGYARMLAGVDREAAVADCEIALALDPSPAFQRAVVFNLASLHRALGADGEAHIAFERCAALGNAACRDALVPALPSAPEH